MKKQLSVLLAAILLLSLLAPGALAASPTTRADILNDLGLFLGTPTGYQLDRAPTRAEAAVMLVRLLGKADEAHQNAYETPYNDVPSWAADEVGYLHHEGLTNGVNPRQFGSNRACEPKMYATFVLRALGYRDGDGLDFLYGDAVNAAYTLGVLDAYTRQELVTKLKFLRSDLVDISWSALAAHLTGGDTTLLQKLVADGSVDAAKAAQYADNLNSFAAFRNLPNTTNWSNHQIRIVSDVKLAFAGVTYTYTGNVIIQSKQADDGTWTIRYEENYTTFEGEKRSVGLYLKDNWLYLKSPDNSMVKYQIETADGSLVHSLDFIAKRRILSYDFSSRKSSSSGVTQTYALKLSDHKDRNRMEITNLMNTWAHNSCNSDAEYNDIVNSYNETLSFDIDKAGRLTQVKQDVTFNIVDVEDTWRFHDVENMSYSALSGSVVFPDLSGYTAMTSKPMRLVDVLSALGL